MWSLGSLTLDDELDVPCEALAHFGLGDLKVSNNCSNDDLGILIRVCCQGS